MDDDAGGLAYRTVTANGVRLRVGEAGPGGGPPAILLHGFPDLGRGWRRQVPALAAAGFRVVVPDGRGYGGSERPRGVHAYALSELAADVSRLADALGFPRFALLGHDWGGVVAWALAATRPERLDRVAILNAPHPEGWLRAVRRSPAQALRSAYVALFRLPRLPEALLRARNFAALAKATAGSARPGAFAPGELDRYRAAWAEPGALTAMLNWYRALPYRTPLPAGPIRVPALVLWGARDPALGRALAADALARCADGRVRFFEGAGHWVHREEPEAVNAALLSFLRA